jgi:hypothetical protein
MDRRKALATFGLTAVGGSLLAACEQDKATPATTDMEPEASADDGLVELLFVQNSQSIKFENGDLTLVDVDPQTLFFSDRPDDLAGFLNYEELVDMVGKGPDNFNEDPPNATLVIFGGDELKKVVVELSEKPHLDNSNIVFPSVTIIAGTIPASGGQAALFIDTIGRPMSPGSAAGAHRRHRRRRHNSRGPGPR